MKFPVVFTLVTYFVYFASSFNCNSVPNNYTVLSRRTRHLDFMKSTRVFFRVNIKNNIFTWGSIWAHAIGFKANMNILNQNKFIRPFRRDTYQVLQELLDLNGLDGQACALKAFCLATRTSDGQMSNGILFKLLRYIFKLNEHDRKHFPFLKEESCDQLLHQYCPLSFNNISPFTDDI